MKIPIDFREKFCMFVVHDTLNTNEAVSNHKTGRNKLGRHTGASPAVLSKLRFGVSCSDLPNYFNQTLQVMHDKTDDRLIPCQACGQPQKPTIELILKEYFSLNEAQKVKDLLWEMFVARLSSIELDGSNSIIRSNLAFHYKELCTLLDKLESIHLKNN